MPSTASGTAFLIAARTCSSLGRTASGCAAMYSSTDVATASFIRLFYVPRRLGPKKRIAVIEMPAVAHAGKDAGGDAFHFPIGRGWGPYHWSRVYPGPAD